MKDFMRPGDLNTVKDVLEYISFYLHRRSERGDENTASSIVGLGGSDHYDEWIRTEPYLEEIAGLASDLEWSNGSPADLRQDWRRIEELIAQLQQRYKS